MTSLRHLNNDGCNALTEMMESQGRRGCKGGGFELQTLPLFVLGGDHDMVYLGRLRNLRGSLKITPLERVSTTAFSYEFKMGIESLGLYWGNDDGCPNINPEWQFGDVEFLRGKEIHLPRPSQGLDCFYGGQVLFTLYPYPNLKRLLIKGYSGCKFPSHFLPKLTTVDLINCRQSENLPVLGHLPFLTSLSLRGMHGVSRIHKHFYCEGNNKPFPVLKELVLVDFPNLEVWSSPDVGEEAFPKLSKLILNKCPKLTVMPQILSTQHLELQECSATLVHSFRNLTSLETLVIANVRDLVYFPGAFPSNNPLLRSLAIKSCPSFFWLPRDLANLAALKSLSIRWCEKLSSLPQSLHNLTALESLEISDCHGLTSLPEGGNGGLSKLRSLSIENCSNLTSLSIGFQYLTSLEILTIMYCPHISTLPQSVGHLSALQSLSILGLPRLNYLPDGLQNLNVLHSLEIGSCPSLKVLPGWVEKLGSLRSLTISGCEDLRSLPDGIECLTALQYLSIHDCPRVLERCKQESGEDWPKIAHVPHKHIGFPKLKRPREEGSSSAN